MNGSDGRYTQVQSQHKAQPWVLTCTLGALEVLVRFSALKQPRSNSLVGEYSKCTENEPH